MSKEKISDRGASRIISLSDKFDKVIIEHGRNVTFGEYRNAVERAGIEIYDGPAPESVFA